MVISLRTNELKFFSAVLLTAAALTACSSEDDSLKQKGMEAGKTYFMTVDAVKAEIEEAAGPAATRALTLSGNTLNAAWATSEQVYVSYGNEWLTGSLAPNANAATAKLNGAISPKSSIPDNPELTLRYPRQDWSYTGQVGTLADISAKYAYATAATNITINGDNVDAASSVEFDNQQAIVKFILKNGSNPVCPTSLRISARGLKSGESTEDDIVITPSGSTNEVFCALRGLTGNLTLTATTAEGIYTYRKTEVSFSHGKYYVITVPMKQKAYPIALSAVTPHYIGSVVGSDGNVYAKAVDVPTGNTAVAMIVHVSGTGHGLALSIADEGNGEITFAAANAALEKTAVSGGSWRVPTLADWNNIITGCNSYYALNSKFTAAGGSPLNGSYWANHDVYDSGYTISKSGNGINSVSAPEELDINLFRACLAFYIFSTTHN